MVQRNAGFKRRCCIDGTRLTTDSYTRPWSTTDAVRLRPPELGHPVQDVARENGFGGLPRWGARSKTISNDRLVAEEAVFHPRLLVIACLVLPPSATDLVQSADRTIASSRPRSSTRDPSGPLRGDDDDRATRLGRPVDRERVVGGVRRHARDVAVDRVDQRHADRCVIEMLVGQGLSHDHPRAVDTEVELLPATPAASPAFHGGPFALADDGQACAVEDKMDAAAGRGPVEDGAPDADRAVRASCNGVRRGRDPSPRTASSRNLRPGGAGGGR